MSLARWQGTVTDSTGAVISNASVTVTSETTGTLAQLYSDRAGVTPITNPTNTDPDGFVYFHVAGDAYRITAIKDGQSRTFRYVPIGTAAEEDKNLITISEATFSGSANIIFSGLNNYRKVEIDIERLIPGTDNTDLYGYVSEDGGGSYLGGTLNKYTLNRATNTTAALAGSSGGSGMLFGQGLGNNTGEFFKSTITIFGHTDTSIYKSLFSHGHMLDAAAAFRKAELDAMIETGGALTNFALQMSSGTMSGKVIYRGEPI